MNWIKYSGIYVILIFIVLGVVTFTTRKEESKFIDRYNSDVMKGVAILTVMLCHFMGTFGGGVTLFTPLGGIGVAIFLMLSGYGLNESSIRRIVVTGTNE